MLLAGPCALCPVAVNCRAEPAVKPAGGLGAAATADNVGAVAAVDAAVSAVVVAGGNVVVEDAVAEQGAMTKTNTAANPMASKSLISRNGLRCM